MVIMNSSHLCTAIKWAAQNGHTEVVKLLLSDRRVLVKEGTAEVIISLIDIISAQFNQESRHTLENEKAKVDKLKMLAEQEKLTLQNQFEEYKTQSIRENAQLIAQNEQLQQEIAQLKTGNEQLQQENAQLKYVPEVTGVDVRIWNHLSSGNSGDVRFWFCLTS